MEASSSGRSGGVPGAESLVIKGTGFHGGDRAMIRQIVAQLGATYSGDLQRGVTTHLVCHHGHGTEKAATASEWGGIPLVGVQWLVDSVQAGRVLPEAGYAVEGGDGARAGAAGAAGAGLCSLVEGLAALRLEQQQQQTVARPAPAGGPRQQLSEQRAAAADSPGVSLGAWLAQAQAPPGGRPGSAETQQQQQRPGSACGSFSFAAPSATQQQQPSPGAQQGGAAAWRGFRQQGSSPGNWEDGMGATQRVLAEAEQLSLLFSSPPPASSSGAAPGLPPCAGAPSGSERQGSRCDGGGSEAEEEEGCCMGAEQEGFHDDDCYGEAAEAAPADQQSPRQGDERSDDGSERWDAPSPAPSCPDASGQQRPEWSGDRRPPPYHHQQMPDGDDGALSDDCDWVPCTQRPPPDRPPPATTADSPCGSPAPGPSPSGSGQAASPSPPPAHRVARPLQRDIANLLQLPGGAAAGGGGRDDDDARVVPLKLLKGAPRGNGVRARHGLASLRGVRFAEAVHVRSVGDGSSGGGLTLSTKDKRSVCALVPAAALRPPQAASALPPLLPGDDDGGPCTAGGVVVCEPQVLYQLPATREWWMEGCRYYSAADLEVLAQQEEEAGGSARDGDGGAGASQATPPLYPPLQLPPDFDATWELARGVQRLAAPLADVALDVRLRKSKRGVGRLPFHTGGSAAAAAAGGGGAGGLYWRFAVDDTGERGTGQGGGLRLLTDQSAADFVVQ